MSNCPHCGRPIAPEPDGAAVFCGRRVEFAGDWGERMRAAIICRDPSSALEALEAKHEARP